MPSAGRKLMIGRQVRRGADVISRVLTRVGNLERTPAGGVVEVTKYTGGGGGGGGADHDAMTIAAAVDAMFDLTGQDLDFNTWNANLVLAGPTSGAAAKPTKRVLVPADLPSTWTLTAAPSSDHSASGILIQLAAHENQGFGDVCYIASDGQAQIADADAIATSSVLVMCADASISANATGNYLLYGIARDDTWNWTVGGLIYLTVTGTTTNTLSQTAPTGTDDVIQILGVATHADRMLFTPSLVQVEHT